jgi:hypothetical protein
LKSITLNLIFTLHSASFKKLSTSQINPVTKLGTTAAHKNITPHGGVDNNASPWDIMPHREVFLEEKYDNDYPIRSST